MKLKQLESDKEALHDQLEEEEEGKRNLEKQILAANTQLVEAKKKAEEEAELATASEEQRKRLAKDIEALMRQIEELQQTNDKLDKSEYQLKYNFILSLLFFKNIINNIIHIIFQARKRFKLNLMIQILNWKPNVLKLLNLKRNKRALIRFVTISL